MSIAASLARACGTRFVGQVQGTCLFYCAALLIGLLASPAFAQVQPIFQTGDAVVTGYSGVSLLKPPPGADIKDFAIINQQGPSLQVFDMSQMNGPDDARLVKARRLFSVSAKQIGQVFGIALDDGRGRPKGEPKTPNIYATATSAFGLQIVKTENGVRNRAKVGGPNRTWLAGQFGIPAGGGPGSIYKIDGNTGEVSLFANVVFDGVANSGPALGNIAFDRRTGRLFVSDLQTGMIHVFGLDGRQIDVYDHGTKGRTKLGLPAVPHDPAIRAEITAPSFDPLNPATWGFAEPGRQVWGLATSGSRLYYSVAEGPEVWSVSIRKSGRLGNDARIEVEVQAPSSDPVSDITFASNGTMYLAQRGQTVNSYDYTVFAQPKTASVLRYGKRKLPSGRIVWKPEPEEYSIGFNEGFRNANGGVALGYGYDQYGIIRQGACDHTVWSTGEVLRQSTQHEARLKPGGPLIVHGLQGNRTRFFRPSTTAPFNTYFIDFDSKHADPTHRGHMGDVEIWKSCPGGATASTDKDPKPKPPKGPRVKIAKSCSKASFGTLVRCRVTLTSTGSEAPRGTVSFTDTAETIVGPPPGASAFLLATITPDEPSWNCTAPPADEAQCSIRGSLLKPGVERFVDIEVSVTELMTVPDWKFRNCARLDGTKQKKCVTRGQNDLLLVSKFGPAEPCVASGPCDFEVVVHNPGKGTFDGDLFFGDNMTIGGGAIGGVTVDGISPTHGCAIASTQLPLEWQCAVTIPPGGEKSFMVLTTIPAGAGQATPVMGRNCFVATDTTTAFQSGALPPDFFAILNDPVQTGRSPDHACVEFEIGPKPVAGGPPVRNPGPGLPPTVIPGLKPGPNAKPSMKLLISADPGSFSKAGEVIKFTYEVENTGNVDIDTYTITDQKVSPGLPIGNCDIAGIDIGEVATCKATYTVKPGDVGKDITTTATVNGTW